MPHGQIVGRCRALPGHLRSAAPLVALCALYLWQGSWALSPEQCRLADSVVSSVLTSQFDRSLELVDSAARADAADPFPLLLRLTVIGMRDVDFDGTFDSTGFLDAYNMAMVRLIDYRHLHGVSSHSLMLDAFAKAIHATFFLRLKSYVNALQTGLEALRLLSEARDLDSTNADVDFFLGLYEYARGELRTRLWWVLFWYPGDKAEGIARLKNCVNNGQLTSTAARISLADIHIRENRTELAGPMLDRLEQEFPGSRFVLWERARYHEARNEFTEAAQIYAQLSESYRQHAMGEYNALVTLNLQAQMLNRAGQHQRAAELCQSILDQRETKRSKGVRKEARKLLDRINENRS